MGKDPRAKIVSTVFLGLGVMVSSSPAVPLGVTLFSALALLKARKFPAGLPVALLSLPMGFGYFLRVLALLLLGELLISTTGSWDVVLALRRLRLPSDFALAAGIALSQIEALARFSSEIQDAQKARGMKGGLGAAKAVAVPLLVRSVLFAMDMGDSIEARGYSGVLGAPYEYRIGPGEVLMIGASFALLALSLII